MNENIQALVKILADTDELFSYPRILSTGPPRCLENGAWASLLERRAEFFAQGLPFVAGGSVEARKRSERLLADLEAAGLVQTFRHAGRRRGARLTDSGDDVARHFAAEPMARDVWHLLRRFTALVDCGAHHNGMLREDDFAATGYADPDAAEKLIGLELDLLPLKARGLLDDHADGQARVWLSLTGAGKAAATQPPPAPPSDLPEYAEGDYRLHSELLDAALAERLNRQPATPGHVVIPLSCGIGPAKTWREAVAE